MKIYTKTGDQGTTSLVGGQRVSKNSARLESYGTMDELNSHIGMVRSFPAASPVADELVEIQRRLFDAGGYLATAPTDSFAKVSIREEDILLLEQAIDRMDASLPPMRSFVLPGGSAAVSACRVARTVCRRAERRILDLAEQEEVDGLLLKYINRLSDYLFILARQLAHREGAEEMKWEARH